MRIVTFAGKGTNRPIRVAIILEQVYGYPADEWEKVRGMSGIFMPKLFVNEIKQY